MIRNLEGVKLRPAIFGKKNLSVDTKKAGFAQIYGLDLDNTSNTKSIKITQHLFIKQVCKTKTIAVEAHTFV
jgi:hypothetical protein